MTEGTAAGKEQSVGEDQTLTTRERFQRIGRIAAFVLPLPLIALPFVLDLRAGPVPRLYSAAAGGFWYFFLFLGVKSALPALAASGVFAYLLAAAGLNAVFG